MSDFAFSDAATTAAIAASSGVSQDWDVEQIEDQTLQQSEADESPDPESGAATTFERSVSVEVNFPFDAQKATEVAAAFLSLTGGRLNVMKLVKLVYLLDRKAIAARGIPVVGGTYFSLRNGPITSELLDLINYRYAKESSWGRFISRRLSYDVILFASPGIEHLSVFETDLIITISREFSDASQWYMRDWCHKYCGEWTELQQGRQPIFISKLAEQVGRQADEVLENAGEQQFLAKIFGE